MDKLNPENIHLLLDEPIYVLKEHFTGHEPKPETDSDATPLPEFKGQNKKGILVVVEGGNADLITTEDEEFIFKGLNKDFPSRFYIQTVDIFMTIYQ